MNIRILGAHHRESGNKKYVCLLIDGILVLDAGALTSSLSAEEQQQLKAVLITHAHYDHIRDIPSLAANLYATGDRIDFYSTESVKQAIESHLLNNVVWPDYLKIPPNRPTLTYRQIVPGKPQVIEGYSVLAISVNHDHGTIGYQVNDGKGKTICYLGDTGPGLSAVWPQIEPQIMAIEVTMPNRCKELALSTGHLTPELLGQELAEFRRVKGYLPRLFAIHMDPLQERDIQDELAVVSRSFNTSLVLSYEGLDFSF